MTYGYENLKGGFDKRVALETKKVQDLKTAFEKIKAQLEAERKSYCVEMKKNLQLYAAQNQIESEQFKRIVLDLLGKVDELDGVYGEAIQHIENVPIAALAGLPKKYETYKKSIRISNKNPAELQKIKDFEYDRLEHTKLSLCHFINAQMFLHAKALELFSHVHNALSSVNFVTEFKDYDRATLREVFKSEGISTGAKENTPR